MTPLRARVENGRLQRDEPTELPDGTELNLVVDDEGDDLTEQERQALHGASRDPGRPLKRVNCARLLRSSRSFGAGGEPRRSNHSRSGRSRSGDRRVVATTSNRST
jgi:hypothetical protein